MQDSHAGIQQGACDQVVTMAAARIFLAAEQHDPLLQGCCHEVMDSLLMPGALAHRCVIKFPPGFASVIAGGIAWAAAERIPGPLVRKFPHCQERPEGFAVKVRDVAAIG